MSVTRLHKSEHPSALRQSRRNLGARSSQRREREPGANDARRRPWQGPRTRFAQHVLNGPVSARRPDVSDIIGRARPSNARAARWCAIATSAASRYDPCSGAAALLLSGLP